MLSKLKKSNNTRKSDQGFTIIEVMIVLAIAGLILLIVLLAVPALQRNSRNTAAKNDASAVTAAISEYESNNDGALPGKTGTLDDGKGTVSVAAVSGSSTVATAKVQSSTSVQGVTSAPAVGNVTPGNIYIAYKFKCANGSTYATTGDITANNRSAVVLYAVEQSGSTVSVKCIDS